MERKAPMSYAAVRAAVLARIGRGEYKPTHRIGIGGIAQALGVSTTPVREALRELAGRDIVAERHREGFYLAPLDARAVAALYAAHRIWMDHILALPVLPLEPGRRSRALWRLFEGCAMQSGDFACLAVRRYLDDRLVVLRRHEAALLGDMSARGAAFARAIASHDREAARAISAAFHAQCEAQADMLSRRLDQGGQGRG